MHIARMCPRNCVQILGRDPGTARRYRRGLVRKIRGYPLPRQVTRQTCNAQFTDALAWFNARVLPRGQE